MEASEGHMAVPGLEELFRIQAPRGRRRGPRAPLAILAVATVPDDAAQERFDAHFFGLDTETAGALTPTERAGLEAGWEALEAGGAASWPGAEIGLWAVGLAPVDSGAPARQLASWLGLGGPAVTVDVQGASPLAGLYLAAAALQAHDADATLVVGLGASGRVIAVLLRRVRDAYAAGDPVLAQMLGISAGRVAVDGPAAAQLAMRRAHARARLPADAALEIHTGGLDGIADALAALATRSGGCSVAGPGRAMHVHAVLGAPRPRAAPDDASARLLLVSARSEAALEAQRMRLSQALATLPTSWAGVCATAAGRRLHFEHRAAVVADSTGEAAHKLLDDEQTLCGVAEPARPAKVAFLFSGYGAHEAGMGAWLYDHEPVFRDALHVLDRMARRRLPRALLSVLFPVAGRESPIDDPLYTPVSLFAVELALAQLLRTWGVTPDAVLGHGMGEVAAATVAGVLSWDQALDLVVERGRAVEQHGPAERLIMVGTSADTVTAALAEGPPSAWIAAVNGEDEVVVSGTEDAVAALLEAVGDVPHRQLGRGGYRSARSPAVQDALREGSGRLKLAPPSMPMASTVTGTLARRALVEPGYWLEQVQAPILFADAVRALYASGCRVFVEIGPRQGLATRARRVLADVAEPVSVFGTMHPDRPQRDELWSAVGRLYCAGAGVDWRALVDWHPSVPLPSYPWARSWLALQAPAEDEPAPEEPESRLDLEPDTGDDQVLSRDEPTTMAPLEDLPELAAVMPHPERDDAALLHHLYWRPAPLETPPPTEAEGTALVLLDGGGLGDYIATWLEARGVHVVRILPGFPEPGAHRDALFVPDPVAPSALRSVLDGLEDAPGPVLVLHMWLIDLVEEEAKVAQWTAPSLGCAAGLHLFQGLVARGIDARMWFITSGARASAGGASVPAAAALWGLGRALAVEEPASFGGMIDLDPEDPDPDAILHSVLAGDGAREAAWRGGARLVWAHAPATLPRRGLRGFDPKRSYAVLNAFDRPGRSLLSWLVQNGARNLVLLSRTSPGPSALRDLILLHERGVHARVCTGDLTNDRDLQRILKLIAEEPALAALLVAPPDLPEAPLVQQHWDAFDRAFETQGRMLAPLLDALDPSALPRVIIMGHVAALAPRPWTGPAAAAGAWLDALGHVESSGRHIAIVDWWLAELDGYQASRVLGRLLGAEDLPVQVAVGRIEDPL